MSILQTKENHVLKASHLEVAELKSKLETFKAMAVENKKLKDLLAKMNTEFLHIKQILDQERDEKMDILQVLLGLAIVEIVLSH